MGLRAGQYYPVLVDHEHLFRSHLSSAATYFVLECNQSLRYRSSNSLYPLGTKGKINVDPDIAQSSHPEVCQPVAAPLLRVNPLHASADVILLLPLVSPSGDRAYQAVVLFGMKIKASPIKKIENRWSERDTGTCLELRDSGTSASSSATSSAVWSILPRSWR